ncbi:MAG: hypothetical protein C0605_04280 [Hyphomicrobiales bacterium]|nr:MAG: hypothetical protein C0605_04280 [Hyphomicrobiales bacterium]
MSGGIEKTVKLGELELPWAKQATIEEITYEGGMAMLRVRIKEGRRFTDIELMPEDAARLAGLLAGWAGKD